MATVPMTLRPSAGGSLGDGDAGAALRRLEEENALLHQMSRRDMAELQLREAELKRRDTELGILRADAVEVRTLRSELGTAKSRIETLMAELRRGTDLKERNRQLMEENELLVAQANADAQRLSETGREQSSHELEVSQLRRRAEAAERESEELRADVTLARGECTDLRSRVSELEQQLETLLQEQERLGGENWQEFWHRKAKRDIRDSRDPVSTRKRPPPSPSVGASVSATPTSATPVRLQGYTGLACPVGGAGNESGGSAVGHSDRSNSTSVPSQSGSPSVSSAGFARRPHTTPPALDAPMASNGDVSTIDCKDGRPNSTPPQPAAVVAGSPTVPPTKRGQEECWNSPSPSIGTVSSRGGGLLHAVGATSAGGVAPFRTVRQLREEERRRQQQQEQAEREAETLRAELAQQEESDRHQQRVTAEQETAREAAAAAMAEAAAAPAIRRASEELAARASCDAPQTVADPPVTELPPLATVEAIDGEKGRLGTPGHMYLVRRTGDSSGKWEPADTLKGTSALSHYLGGSNGGIRPEMVD